ncbi:MAG TPA: metalloregulator ArsR/SmtB family transcription factor [Anaerolineaceae bacterium]
MNDENNELLTFLKALADANRLKIVGLLVREACTVEQIAAILGVSESTISHHLSKLSEAGLVTATAQSYYNYYRLEKRRMKEMAHRLLSFESLPAAPATVDTQEAYDRKIVNDYLLPDGRLKTIPAQRKKLLVVLRYILQSFEPGKRYTEAQVNKILARFHDDTATLRRGLISEKMMDRESSGSAYWRSEEPAA